MKILSYLKLMRIKHYFKNLLIFLPLIFSMSFYSLENDIKTLIGFILFSLVCSMVYIINDINDSTGMLNVFGESILNKTDIGRKYISKSSQLVSNTSKSQPWMGCYYEK
jgi:hypothetical protein